MIKWVIEEYEKAELGYLTRMIATVGVDAEFIRRVWSLPDDDPGYGLEWPVTPENLTEVQPHVVETMDLDAFDYFLCDEPAGAADEGIQ
ncbi:hypothetical protein GCM10023321_74750 [Pseudonocardia eucalypti]|uniref:DUF7683 domain-containing protein n=1 Tax=Pseudonocardia eucalypti TaxID=648755 RepID=A0ABP9RAG2_9PSEU